jgi:phosphopantothenoylcysteine decarboxylase/phosphopantothenate--cysteine ligase
MKVLLGVCGGVASYKAVELTRELRRRGASVQVILTANAERFVTPLTFAATSGSRVLRSLWETGDSEVAAGQPESFEIEHIRVAQERDLLVVAPATANFLATLTHGLAPDLLSTVCLATKAPIVVAPAMNVNMWWNPVTQANLEVLRGRGIHIVAPGSGDLACGMVGEGRLADPSAIADRVFQVAEHSSDLNGETILITAGGTREPIDAVRFLGNRSSGKMAYALAEAALRRGANVILISAATTAVPPVGCEHARVTTAAEMERAVLQHLPRATIVIMAAAVSDYQVLSPSSQKRKKTSAMTLELTQTPDILRQVVQQRASGTLVAGFAAETEHVLEEGRRKLIEKGADMIVANDVSSPNTGFESDHNAGTIITHRDEQALPLSSKQEMAQRILDSLHHLRKNSERR